MREVIVRATLIYNPNAAGTSGMTTEAILGLLEEAGFEAIHAPTESEEDLALALAEPGDLVVVAGGDGSVRHAALALRGRHVPIAILPLGTANNIARSLGLGGGVAEIIAGLADPQCFPFDVGHVAAPWGEDWFLEGCGLGLFADTMAAYDPEEGKSVLRAVRATLSTLADYRPHYRRLRLDGEDLSGEYLLAEVMNTRQVGPRLRLAPQADPSDGLFDLVLVHEDNRIGLGAYLEGFISGDLERLENVTVRRGRRLEINWDGTPFHIDGSATSGPLVEDPSQLGEAPAGVLELTLEQGALDLWLPRSAGVRGSP